MAATLALEAALWLHPLMENADSSTGERQVQLYIENKAQYMFRATETKWNTGNT